MKIEAVTLIRPRRFNVELRAKRFGLRQWLVVQLVGFAVMLAGDDWPEVEE